VSQRTFILALTAATLLVCGRPALAEHAAEDLFSVSLEDLAAIKVESASRHEEDLMGAPAAITVVTRDDIRHSAAHTLVEVLQYVVGLDGYTKTRTDMDVIARGMAQDESAKILVLIDGQPVNVAPYGGVQWPTLPLLLDDIERIEVVRGAASAVYGADAVTGVINIMTLAAADRENRATVMVGEDGTQRYSVGGATALGPTWNLAASASFWRTESGSHHEEYGLPGLPENWSLKDQADIWQVGFRLDHSGDQSSFTSEGGFSTGEEGYNPSPGDLVIDRSQKRTFWLNNAFSRAMGDNSLELRVGARNLWQENEDFTGDDYRFKYRLDRGLGVDADAHYLVQTLPHQTLIVGANLSYVAASRNIANDPPYEYDESETLVAAYLQDQIHLLDRRLLLTLSGRYDKWANLDGQFSPRAAVNYFLADRKVNLRAIVGTSFRRPSFDENFYFVSRPGSWFKGAAVDAVTADGRVIEGEFLEAEHLLDMELGVRMQPNKKFQLDISAFRHFLDDALGYEVYYAADGVLNLGHSGTGNTVTVRGVESAARLVCCDRISAFLNYTYQDAEREEPGGGTTTWETAPRHKVSGGFRYNGPVIIDLRGRYVDAVRYDEAPLTPVDSYTTFDVAVSRRLGSFTVKLSATDLLDDEHFEYPLYSAMTRKVMGLVRYEF